MQKTSKRTATDHLRPGSPRNPTARKHPEWQLRNSAVALIAGGFFESVKEVWGESRIGEYLALPMTDVTSGRPASLPSILTSVARMDRVLSGSSAVHESSRKGSRCKGVWVLPCWFPERARSVGR
jgi:hypothetical protein